MTYYSKRYLKEKWDALKWDIEILFVVNDEKPNWCPLQPLEMALQVVGKYYPKETEIDWRKEFEDMVRYIGVVDYGKERWFMETEKDGRVRWYDRYDGEYLTTDELQHRIYEVVRKLDV